MPAFVDEKFVNMSDASVGRFQMKTRAYNLLCEAWWSSSRVPDSDFKCYDQGIRLQAGAFFQRIFCDV